MIAFSQQDFDRVVKRYAKAVDKAALVSKGVVAWGQAEAIKEARHQLDTLVYKAALPPSAGPGYERSGRTRRAVSKRPIITESLPGGRGEMVTGEVFVDRNIANRDGFYYPAVLNRGRTDIRYWPRPFWSATKALIKVRYEKHGPEALHALRKDIAS